jgi:hypothetical protein
LVVLAHESYIKELLEIYTLPVASVHLKVARGFEIPAPHLRFSGTCILLRENDNESEDEHDGRREIKSESGAQRWTAHEVAATDIERAFFGDYRMHKMTLYVSRVSFLSKVKIEHCISDCQSYMG